MENLFNDIIIDGTEERYQNIYTGEWTTKRGEYGTIVGEYVRENNGSKYNKYNKYNNDFETKNTGKYNESNNWGLDEAFAELELEELMAEFDI